MDLLDIMSKVQELKLNAWKGGYLSGTGRCDAAWAMRPVLQKTIDEIRVLLISKNKLAQGKGKKPGGQPPKNRCQ